MITAHAGSDGYRPNSISFINKMLDEGVETLEIDCTITEDGIIYLRHDPVLDIRGILTLDLAFELIASHHNTETNILIDCKNVVIGRIALDKAEAYDLKERIILAGKINYGDFSFQEREQLFYNVENEIHLKNEFSIDEFKEALNRWYEDGIRYIQSDHEHISHEILTWIRESNLQVSVSTVDDFDLINDMLDRGVYNIITDRALEYLAYK